MTYDSTFRFHGALRLLHQGLLSGGTTVADPFSTDRLTDSVLGLPDSSFSSPAMQGPCPWLEWLSGTGFSGSDAENSRMITLPGSVYLCGPCTSSMDVARALAAMGELPVWGSVVALSQRSGRGQLGRSWISPEGNLFAALRLPEKPPFTGTAAAPAVGALMAEALSSLGCPVSMKWPNDLLGRDENLPEGWCKVGGILLEERPLPHQNTGQSERLLLAGIGLNLVSAPPADLMRAQHAVPAGKLSFPQKNDSNPHFATELWMRLVSRIFFCYVKEIDARGKNAWRSLAERYLAFLGQTVLLTDGPDDRECHSGVLEGLDDFGGLRLRTREGATSFLSGSLQLNRPPMQP